MDRNAPDVVRMTEVVALNLLLDVVQNDDAGHEVDDLSGREQVQVGAAIPTSVSVDPFEARPLLGNGVDFGQRILGDQVGRHGQQQLVAVHGEPEYPVVRVEQAVSPATQEEASLPSEKAFVRKSVDWSVSIQCPENFRARADGQRRESMLT